MAARDKEQRQHLDRQIAIPHTVVLADELSTSAVLAGIMAGNSWIAGTAAVSLSLQVRAGDQVVGIGEQVEIGGEPAVVGAEVGGVPSGMVSFHTDRGAVPPRAAACRGAGYHRMAYHR